MNHLLLGLLALSFLLIELLIGGTRLLFSLPSYAILSLAAILSLGCIRRPIVSANVDCLWATAIFFGYILLRIAVSPVEYIARSDLFVVLGSLIVYLLLALYLTHPRHRLLLVLGLLFLGLIHTGIGAIQFMRREHFPIFSFIEVQDYGLRASGLYICPNHLAGFLEVVAVLGLGFTIWGRLSPALKIYTTYASIISLVGILMTGSRGGYLSTALGLLVFAALSLNAVRKKNLLRGSPVMVGLIIFASLVTLAGLVYFGSSQQLLQLRWTKDPGDARVDLWQSAVNQFKLNPVVGTGSATYLYYGRLFRTTRTLADPEYTHNDYLQLLAEFGLVGLVLCILFLASHVAGGIKSFNHIVRERITEAGRIRSNSLALNIGAISAVATYCVHSLLDFNLHIPANALLLAIVFGILANPGVSTPVASMRFRDSHSYFRLALPTLGLVIAFLGLPTLPGELFCERARVAVRNEQYTNGVLFAEKAILHDKRNPYAFLYSGQAYFELGEAASQQSATNQTAYSASAQAFEKGLTLFPQDTQLLLGLGWSLDAMKRHVEADQYFKKAVAWDPNSAQVRFYYASHLHVAGKLDEAEVEYNKSNQLHWNLASALGLEQLQTDRKAGSHAVPQ